METESNSISPETRNEIESQMDEAIKLTMSSMGLDIDDPEVIKLVKGSLRKLLEEISANVTFYSGGKTENGHKVLQMKYLKSALQELGIRIDRPEYILEQQQSQNKMNTRNKNKK